jgi:steroid delta-isomerase-like uncharacterized protein
MYRSITIYTMIIFAILAVCVPSYAQTPDELIAIRNAFDKALNEHDMDEVLSYCTDDFLFDFVPNIEPLDREGTRAFFEESFASSPDWHTTEGPIRAIDNIVVVEHMVAGTNTGAPWQGIPTTGKAWQLPHVDVYEFEGDKIKKITTYIDMASLMIQLGVMPAAQLDPALLVPSFTLPEAEPTGLGPVESEAEGQRRWNSHDLFNMAKGVHPDAEILIAPLGVTLNRAGYIASQELYFLGFPDISMETVRSVDIGDGWVLNEVVWKGTNIGPYFGIPATRRPIQLRGAYLSRWDAEGLETNLHIYFDNLTVLAQLGLFPPPDLEANKAVIRRQTEDLWNQGNLGVIDEIYAADYIRHDPVSPEIIGSDGVKQLIATYRTAFPDVHFTVDDLVAEGDLVAGRFTSTGTNTGDLMMDPPIPATGVQGTLTHISIYRIVNGKIVEEWAEWDALGMMQQLGVMPPTRGDYTWGAPSDVTGDGGDPAVNTALVLYVVQKFWNEQNVNALDTTHSLDSIAHNPVIPGQPLPFYMYKNVCLVHLAAFPDMRVTTENIIAEADKVAINWTVTGTQLGALMGIPATGRPVKFTGITIYRFASGKIVENWWAYDALGMIQQITTPPESEPPQE